jgi:hypothetical protein
VLLDLPHNLVQGAALDDEPDPPGHNRLEASEWSMIPLDGAASSNKDQSSDTVHSKAHQSPSIETREMRAEGDRRQLFFPVGDN